MGSVTAGLLVTPPARGGQRDDHESGVAGRRIDEIAEGIFRISTPVTACRGVQLQPVPDRGRAAACCSTPGRAACSRWCARPSPRVMPVERLRYVGLLALRGRRVRRAERVPRGRARAPSRVCGQIAAMVSIDDVADRPPRALADGEVLALGRHAVALARRAARAARLGVRLPVRGDARARCSAATCSPSGGAEHAPLTESDILGPSEAMRRRWTTSPTRRHARGARDAGRARARRRSPACTAAPGAATAAALLRALADSVEGPVAAATAGAFAGGRASR